MKIDCIPEPMQIKYILISIFKQNRPLHIGCMIDSWYHEHHILFLSMSYLTEQEHLHILLGNDHVYRECFVHIRAISNSRKNPVGISTMFVMFVYFIIIESCDYSQITVNYLYPRMIGRNLPSRQILTLKFIVVL